jgi:arsenical pump membrane protein
VAVLAAGALVASGAISLHGAGRALGHLGPTIGFLAALLVLADGCRRAGLFDALGALMAARTAGNPRRLLAIVFGVAAATTAVLSLDATVVLLTPIVFATAARLRVSPRPHVYGCSHLANSGSLLLPVSNLTNLLAFAAAGVSFTRFGALMALPWLGAIAVEWVVLSRVFAGDLRRPAAAEQPGAASAPARAGRLPVVPMAIVLGTLAGFAVSSPLGVAPVWFAATGAVLITVCPPLPAPLALLEAAEPTFLVFVLGLGVTVAAAGDHGLSSAVRTLIPHGAGFLELLGVAALSAALANLVNNLPATLIMVPILAGGAPGPALAMLIGVDVGPNLTYVGSLATLLWRRVVRAHDEEVDIAQFLKLGLLTVPASLVLCTGALWLALQVI